jgi:hypothetical protein
VPYSSKNSDLKIMIEFSKKFYLKGIKKADKIFDKKVRQNEAIHLDGSCHKKLHKKLLIF